jgi:putative acetyltransferase
MSGSEPAQPGAAPTQVLERYTLRRATNRDGPGVWTLIGTVLASYGIVADRESTDQDLVDLDRSFAKEGGAFFVLLDGERVVGTVALRRETETVCELCRMYLAPEHRGRGLGRRLLAFAEAEARQRGFKEIVLKTASVLKEAIALYRQAGFQPIPGAPACGNCDLAMRKKL